MNEIICGNCIEVLEKLPEASVDLIVTSPPYAEQRKNFYNSISEEKYPTWTVEWMEKCSRVLKPTGSVTIVIRPHIRNNQISDYVLKTRLELRKGWNECEEFIWIKPNSPPLGSVKMPRRAWESILWFSRSKKPFCDAKANGQPSNRVGFQSKKGVGEYKSGVCEPKIGIARCRDYIEVGTSGVDRATANTHPAQFPVEVPVWIIKMLSPPKSVILDPFLGSGSTAIACLATERNYIGIEISEDYCEYAHQRVEEYKKKLLSPKGQ